MFRRKEQDAPARANPDAPGTSKKSVPAPGKAKLAPGKAKLAPGKAKPAPGKAKRAPGKAAPIAAKGSVPGKAGPASAATMSSGKQAYETRRAAEAGLTLEAWLARKARDAAREAAARTAAAKAPPKKKGLIGRLLDRAHQPIQPKKG